MSVVSTYFLKFQKCRKLKFWRLHNIRKKVIRGIFQYLSYFLFAWNKAKDKK